MTMNYSCFFRAACFITTLFPQKGSRFLDSFAALITNPYFIMKNYNADLTVLKRVKKFKKILLIGDLNIGDAINIQAAASAVRSYLPRVEIDYVISRKASNLINGNPEISRVFPIYCGRPFPSEEDRQKLKQILNSGKYDLVFNFCPFFKGISHFNRKLPVINFSTLALLLVNNEIEQTGINHVAYRIYRYLLDLMSFMGDKKIDRAFPGITITLPEFALKRAKSILDSREIISTIPLVMLNPDTTSIFTKIPFNIQVFLLKTLAEMPCRVILGRGIHFPGIEKQLLEAVPSVSRNNIFIPPAMSIEEYAALLDYVDMFITGDTGPLHIAAARKYSGNNHANLRNRTAVLSIFGATPSRLYGYDSSNPLYLSANQDAPSRVFVAGSSCRNITCINKIAKCCKTVHCFDSLNGESIVSYIRSYLNSFYQ